MIVAIALIAALLLGVVLIIVGLRGRRIDDHPLCRKCGFDLTGKPVDSTRCPECGVDLKRRRAVVIGHRRRQPILFAVGSVLFLSTLSVEAPQLIEDVTTINWMPHLPAFALALVATSVDPNLHPEALEEVLARANANRLSGWSATHLATHTLREQKNSQGWDSRWGELLERLHDNGAISDESWVTYARQALPGSIQLNLRPIVRNGDPLPYEFKCEPVQRANSTKLVEAMAAYRIFLVEAPQIEISEKRKPFYKHDWVSFWTVESAHGQFDASQLSRLSSKTASHAVQVKAELKIGTRNQDGTFHRLAEGLVTSSQTFTLSAADQPSVTDLFNNVSASEMSSSIKISSYFFSDRDGKRAIAVAIESERVEDSKGFDIFLNTGAGEQKIGELLHPGDGPLGMGVVSVIPAGSGSGGYIDLILKSNPKVAVTSLTTTNVWHGELKYHGITVAATRPAE